MKIPISMVKQFIFPTILLIVLNACKTSKPIDLPEYTVELNNPNTVPNQSVYQASNTRYFDLLHTKLDVKFNWDKSYLYGKAELTLKPYFEPTNKLTLNARGQDINKVLLIDGGNQKELTYMYDGYLLTVYLDKIYSRNEQVKVFIDYTSKPEELVINGSAAIKSDKGLYFINPKGEEKNKPSQIWTQGETESSQVWFPTIDSPNERCTGEIAITVEEKYKTLSNGLLTHQELNGDGTRTDFWEMDQPHAPYLFMMAIGDFAVVKDKWENMEVSYYVEPEYEKDARAIFGLTPEMISFFSQKLGVKYPWKKYSQVVVRDYVSGAMENTTAVIHGDFVQQTTRELIDGSAGEDVISHELFHHWFGDLVTCESWSNLPLNESFATYGEYLWKEYKYGKDYADFALLSDFESYLAESEEKKVDLIRFDYEKREDMFDAHSYQKGGLVLNMLRNYLGDDAFFESLKYYLNKHQYTDVEMHEFRIACEDISGKDLNWFFNQWFYSSGHPELNISYYFNDTTNTQIVNIEQTQDFRTTPLYKLPLKVDIYVDGKVQTHSVNADEAINSFVFNVSKKPDFVNVDADNYLLAEKIDTKTDSSEWAYLFLNSKNFIDRFKALLILSEISAPYAQECIVKAISDSNYNIQKLALESLNPSIVKATPNLKESLVKIAKNGAKTSVRAAAIEALSLYYQNDTDLMKIYESGLLEESYLVSSYSLRAIANLNQELAMEKAKSLQDEKNSNVSKSVSYVYEKFGGYNEHEYFKKILMEDNDVYGKYYAISSYGNYLKRQEIETISESVELLDSIALKNKSWWNRLSGISVVADLENFLNQQVDSISTQLKKADGDKTALESKLEKTKQTQKQFFDIIRQAIETEKHPYIKMALGTK
ncbi:MAG: M1 family metallopeptidase [Flavobacteriales bacterium]|nr:M1 family metallopeptidase [Flavobacteriales bacterium]